MIKLWSFIIIRLIIRIINRLRFDFIHVLQDVSLYKNLNSISQILCLAMKLKAGYSLRLAYKVLPLIACFAFFKEKNKKNKLLLKELVIVCKLIIKILLIIFILFFLK